MELTRYATNDGRGISYDLWKSCPRQAILADNNFGFYWRDDFTNPSLFASATSQAGYMTYQDTGVTIQGLATELGGVLQFAGADADNDEGSLQTGAGKAGFCMIDDSGDGKQRLWLECRVRFPVITDWAVFIGLAEENAALADALADNTGALADKDFVGFRILTADPDGLDVVHKTNGGSEVVVKEEAQVIVAATWYKLGIEFDGTNVWWYVNGVRVNTDGVLPAATDFPDGEELAPLFAIKTGAAVEKKLDIDWFECFQLRP